MSHGLAPSSPVIGTHHMRKGPEQQPKLSSSCGGAGVAGKQVEPKVLANSQVVPVGFGKPA